MEWKPPSEESLRELRDLANRARQRGDDILAVLVDGMEVFISLEREVDLLEFMRTFEAEMRPAVEGTPSAAELDQLYRNDR